MDKIFFAFEITIPGNDELGVKNCTCCVSGGINSVFIRKGCVLDAEFVKDLLQVRTGARKVSSLSGGDILLAFSIARENKQLLPLIALAICKLHEVRYGTEVEIRFESEKRSFIVGRDELVEKRTVQVSPSKLIAAIINGSTIVPVGPKLSFVKLEVAPGICGKKDLLKSLCNEVGLFYGIIAKWLIRRWLRQRDRVKKD